MNDYEKEKKAIIKIQSCIFPILCEIDDFCKKRNIRYFLCAGTCLGAVRHHNFIPWDYDADIMFPRKDYERFIHEYYYDNTRKYAIGALEIDPNWKRPFGRVWDKDTVLKHKNLQDVEVGACVDLFPIDGFTGNKIKGWVNLRYMRLLEFLGFNSEKTHFHKDEKLITIKKFLRLILKPLGWRFFSERMNILSSRYPYDNSDCVGVWIDPGYGRREIMGKDIFESELPMAFHGVELPVPVKYDEYLHNLFDDYTIIPDGAIEHCYKQIDDWELFFNKEN